MLHITYMNFEVALCGSTFYVGLLFVIPNNNDKIHQMTERRACDVICVTKRIFIRSFVKPKNIRIIRLLGFNIRFTTTPSFLLPLPLPLPFLSPSSLLFTCPLPSMYSLPSCIRCCVERSVRWRRWFCQAPTGVAGI